MTANDIATIRELIQWHKDIGRMVSNGDIDKIEDHIDDRRFHERAYEVLEKVLQESKNGGDK